MFTVRRPLCLPLVFLAASLSVCGAFSQTSPAKPPVAKSDVPGWATAANRWRLTPTAIDRESDTVAPELRAARNSFLGPRLQIASNAQTPFVSYNYDQPAVDPVFNFKNGIIWIVATFKDAHAHAADSSAQLIYTEIRVEVNKVVSASSSASLKEGSIVDVVEYGGRVLTPSGEIHSFRLQPSAFSLEPNRRYILALFPRDHNFYTVNRFWDVTGGTVLASSVIDQEQVQRNRSQLVGLSEANAIAFIDGALKSRN